MLGPDFDDIRIPIERLVDDKTDAEAKKHVHFADTTNNYTLVSPRMKHIMNIKSPRIKISANALAFDELKHIEEQIINQSVMPDFGYNSDNYILDRGDDAARNWQLLTEIVANADRYDWLLNHIKLQNLRSIRKNLEEDKRQSHNKKMQMMQQQALMQASMKESNNSLHQPNGQREMNELLKQNETTANFLKTFR